MKSLEQIATHYGTAKVPHGYMEIYEMFFQKWREKPIRLLEIGVATGASMKTWCEYFKKGYIVGVDKDIQHDYLQGISDKCTLIEGDATTIEIKGKFDIIIDDGSHLSSEQVDTFWNFWPLLNPMGLYIVEDLFALFDRVWNSENYNILELIHKRMENILTGGDEIQEVHYYGRNDVNGILFLRKRYEEFRHQPMEEFKMIER